MQTYTREVQTWLEQRFRGDPAAGKYHAHQPIYGFGRGDTEPGHLPRLTRIFKLLRMINELEFHSVLDVGGGEGYLAHHIRDLFGAEVVTSDLSLEANRRAWELYGLHGVGIHAAQLPFKDGAFDLVVCSEVLEHVENAVDAILELDRVARKYVIITTQEACPSRLERWLKLRLRDFSHPHYEINWWHPADFTSLLGKQTSYAAQIYFRPFQETGLSENELDDIQAKSLVRRMACEIPFGKPETWGIVVWKYKTAANNLPLYSSEALLEHVFTDKVIPEQLKFAGHEFDSSLLAYLACPTCLASLTYQESELLCATCGHKYRIENGIPLMYPACERPVSLQSRRHSGLRRMLSLKNVAQSELERAMWHRALSYYYSWRAFCTASTDTKIAKIRRRLFPRIRKTVQDA